MLFYRVGSPVPTMAEQKRLAGYQLLQRLGSGRMGVVYKAYDPRMGRVVALKTLAGKPWSANRNGYRALRQRLRREASVGQRLRHPNIVPVYRCGYQEGQFYTVMAFIDGRSLAHYLKQGRRFSLREVHKLMHSLLSALNYAHDHGIVHRDIKPGNLLLASTGKLWVTDFGIATIDPMAAPQAALVTGTPGYMAPEQCLGLATDARADIFSAGVLLYELLTGEKPFTGSSSKIRMQNVVRATPASPSQLNPAIPGQIDTVTLTALAKRPDDRFASAKLFAEALDAAFASSATPVTASH